MADHPLDDLIHTLARALADSRHRCAHAHLQRLQARLGAGQTLVVRSLVDGQWLQHDVPLAELIVPRGILATTLEVQLDCEVEEVAGADGLPARIALHPCTGEAEHRLTICLHGGTPLHGELLLDGQSLRRFSLDPPSTAEA
ncbi:hypothetical protein [Stenotrophomonas sp. BIGb0135]|jgi:hypothetical protein|uniref:Type III secretion system protein n=1 Tax=Stenotrophomonas nematodicola TaxID=2656746 RepID=A0ABW7D6R2_9GAMM|nr:hypothetical protein [Stenotrophomonas sp. BIGb0135]MCS4235879.1 hypothetical protein [Stenotrophomonas sp. BIGb0135]